MSVHESRSTLGWATDKHLPVIDSVGILEDVDQSSDSRVLHVERETGVAVLELLDGLVSIGVGILLEGGVRRKVEARRIAHLLELGEELGHGRGRGRGWGANRLGGCL